MSILALVKHVIWVRQNSNGGPSTYYYDDQTTWIVGALALAWLVWFMVRRYRHARALRRPPRRTDRSLLKRIVKTKNELSSTYLRPGFSQNIHAVGIGLLGGSNDYCLQVFVN